MRTRRAHQEDLQVLSPSPPSPHSAAERRAAEAELRALVARFAPAYERLVGATRKWRLGLLPAACEIVYEYCSRIVLRSASAEKR